jgi:hypothetical protein
VRFCYRFLAIRGFATNFNVQTRAENSAYTLADRFMIIGNENAHPAGSSRLHDMRN